MLTAVRNLTPTISEKSVNIRSKVKLPLADPQTHD